jgi:diphosphomevalonate decarboxylase
MSKATAKAYSNIALVKYWGKGDETLRLPVNTSIAVGLDAIFTTTTVEFSDSYAQDEVAIDGDVFSSDEVERVSHHLDLIRTQAQIKTRAKVVTKNNFPKAVGAASSASGFAALTVAAATAAGLTLSEKDLSIIARQGSGSATRSVTGGISQWQKGTSSETSFAEKIESPAEWNLKVLLVFVGELQQKKVGSTEGMRLASTSPYFETAVVEAGKNIERLRSALSEKNWQKFGQVIEDECYRLHLVCMSSTPNILYWEAPTVAIFQKLLQLRETKKVYGFFTVDAGPHVHVVCQEDDVELIKSELKSVPSVTDIIECGVAPGAQILNDHLF